MPTELSFMSALNRIDTVIECGNMNNIQNNNWVLQGSFYLSCILKSRKQGMYSVPSDCNFLFMCSCNTLVKFTD